jgi:hypothetical protein
VVGAMASSFDTNKYFEDFARVLLGSKSYLLFQFDKLVSSVIISALII